MNATLAMTLRRPLFHCFWWMGGLAACGGLEMAGDETLFLSTHEAAEQSAPPTEGDGWPMQGTQLHGSNLVSASFTRAMLGTDFISNLHLEMGELVGSVPYTLTGSAPSLLACKGVSKGSTRSCGFTSVGVGTCTPGMSVTLGSGAASSCWGQPVVRVCTGTQPCEHLSASRLASAENACIHPTPIAAFTCPPSGLYNVLAGPSQTGTGLSWGVNPAPNNGAFPGKRVVRGVEMIGARLQVLRGGEDTWVSIGDVVNASQVQTAAGKAWDDTGNTFLYRLTGASPGGPPEDVCPSDTDHPNGMWAVPMDGVFNPLSGEREDNEPKRFTFGCDTGVIAKCYRWGYKPWLLPQDLKEPKMMQDLHLACTRMARADYCGNGTSHTQNGTPIHPWDRLPNAIRPLAPGTDTPLFEAGWSPTGAVCLSKTRWENLKPLPATCPLVAPGWLVPGAEGVPCPPGQLRDIATGKLCATVCNSEEDALAYQSTLKLFNESQYNFGP
ncbi:ADYC domain-containing protein [Stigmatella sp. ncwal1]|uniref:ADYC domain-containing protein n=1 Tax=Stigmatella ashevillensis TaxID=2995309 RepID=A0ABT5DHM7_9BACT|nr:ADYC domain-containing protein [Stigmatella ashevillena]MDC0713172.1 ADYC domain-containing protein [Stigmatella ashevillena]